MLSAEAGVKAIAEAYRAAAMAQADMRYITEALESVRESMAGQTGAFRVWDMIDDQIGKAYGRAELRPLRELREWFLQYVAEQEIGRIKEAWEVGQDNGWGVFINSYAEALAFWKIPLCLRLSEIAITVEGLHQPDMNLVKQRTHYILKGLWPEARPLFLYLIGLESLPPQYRARFNRILGQIELYHLNRLPEAKSYFDAAQKLDPEDSWVLVGEGEYWLYQNYFDKAKEFMQRAILNDPASAIGYSYTGDCFDREGNTEMAEKWYREAIDKRPGDSSGYLGLVKLLARIQKNDQNTITSLLDQAHSVDPDGKYDSFLDAGYAYEQANRFDLAHQHYQKAVEFDSTRTQSYTSEGYLFLKEGNIEEARRCFAKAIEVIPESFDGYWGMAYLCEQLPDWTGAEHWYQESLSRRKEWDGLIRALMARAVWKQGRHREGTERMLAALRQEPESNPIRSWAERMANDINEELKDLNGAKWLFGEIREILGDSYEALFQYNLGNLYYSVHEYNQAIKYYQNALAADPSGKVYYSNIILCLQETKDYELGRYLLKQAPREVQQDQNFRKNMAILRNSEANDYFSRRDYRFAAQLYEGAIEMSPQDAVLYSNLALALESDKSRENVLERLERAVTALRQAIDLNPDSSDNRDYALRLQRLEALKRLSTAFGEESLLREPVVTPIDLEVAANLLPLVANASGQLTPQVLQLIDQMRKDILSLCGVNVPGVLVRGNETDLPDGTYIISLKEVPIVSYQLPFDRRFSPASPEALKNLEVMVERGKNPETGRDGSWLEEQNWDKVQAAGYEVWEVLQYPVRHLQDTIKRNLTDFFGIQDAYNLVNQQADEQLKILANISDAIPTLTRILRALLAEQVPITAFAAICEKFIELHKAGLEPFSIAEQVRSIPEISQKLPGNNQNTKLWIIGEDIAIALDEAIYRKDHVPVLAMEPEICQEILTALRGKVGVNSQQALVIKKGELRPFLRKLVELEWPDLPVLAQNELLPGLDSQVVGEIRLNG